MRTLLTLTPLEFLWITIGVILTALGTQVVLVLPPSVPVLAGYSFSLQLVGVLLTGCLGGAGAGFYSQLIYLILGLAGLQIFSYGGGLDYLNRPTFGYLLGFLPGSWVCGLIAFRKPQDPTRQPSRQLRLANPDEQPLLTPPTLPSVGEQFQDIVIACFSGLAVIHLTGLTYLVVQSLWQRELITLSLRNAVLLLPGQCLVILGVTLVALFLRRLMFY